MSDKRLKLLSPKGTWITGTLERLSGCALIATGSIRKLEDGALCFDYEGSTEIFWDDQRTVTEGDDRVFLDDNGEEFLESELQLVRDESTSPLPEVRPADLVGMITVTVRGGVVQDIEGIPGGITVRVVDFDTDGADEESLTAMPDGSKANVDDWRQPKQQATT